MPRGEHAPQPGQGEQGDQLQAALQTLEAGIDSILSSEGFAAYLATMARFHSYSPSNVALILTQAPEATRVAGYKKWQELGRQVRKGEKGIVILVPHKRRQSRDHQDVDEHKEEETTTERTVFTSVSGFGIGRVFDVLQTDGDPLPEPPRPEVVDGASDTGMRLYADLLDYLELHGVTTNREDTEPANGYYQPFNRHVGIGRHIDGDQATKTLTHEVAHMVSGDLSGIERRDAETVAESAAFVVLTHYGIDSSNYTFPYVATWAQDRAVLKRNLAAIQQVSHRIIADIEGKSRSNHFPHSPRRLPFSLLDK
jgi:antirestriction protein ArdC